MLTVQSLLDELDLELTAGTQAAEAPVRWVHISELEDPTPWLSGGELMLTTGIPLSTAAKQRAFVGLLADHNLAGLGFGTGFNHDKMPKALVEEAKKRDFPLFEVPYSTPFIAITEKAFAGSSAWSWKSAAWRRSWRRLPPRSVARWRSSAVAASVSPGVAFAASSRPRR